MEKVFIGLGSNLGDRRHVIRAALDLLEKNPGIKINKISSLIETEPVDGPPQPFYLNGVLEIFTDLKPADLLHYLQSVEKKLGRKRGVKNGPRTIDLDILLYGEETIETDELKIPHPRMWQRDFVIEPLKEIAPAIVDARRTGSKAEQP